MRRFNRVLLPTSAEYMNVSRLREGQVVIDMQVDDDALQYLLQEFISVGSVQLAVDPHHRMYQWTSVLPPRLRRYIKRIDSGDRSVRKVHAWLVPILDDFGSSSDYIFTAAPHQDLPDVLKMAITALSLNMRSYILGLDYQIQVDINVDELLAAVKLLRLHAEHPEAKHNLAVLEGVFSSYTSYEIDAPCLVSSATEEAASVYRDLIDDAEYRLLSTHIHGMGFREHLEYSLISIRRQVRDLLRHPRFSTVLELGQQMIFASTGVSGPDSASLAKLIGGDYLPPIVKLTDLVHRARVAWKPDSIDIRTVDLQRETVSLTIGPSDDGWNPYWHVPEHVRRTIDSNSSVSEFEIDGWSCKHRDITHFNTNMHGGELRLELILSNGLAVVFEGKEKTDTFMDAFGQWVRYCQTVAYDNARSPYGRTIDGQRRWLWEQAQLHSKE